MNNDVLSLLTFGPIVVFLGMVLVFGIWWLIDSAREARNRAAGRGSADPDDPNDSGKPRK